MTTCFEDAKVRWFDNFSGEGYIRLGTGESIYIHYSAIRRDIKLGKNNFYRMLFSNSVCKVKVIRDLHFTQIEELI